MRNKRSCKHIFFGELGNKYFLVDITVIVIYCVNVPVGTDGKIGIAYLTAFIKQKMSAPALAVILGNKSRKIVSSRLFTEKMVYKKQSAARQPSDTEACTRIVYIR